MLISKSDVENHVLKNGVTPCMGVTQRSPCYGVPFHMVQDLT